ncbi:hypothetical protein AVEN_191882-1 [Araneus ventricosus]|uniref:Uncharacterized protein n=1 Tax=Araneus ventricosus TaxID=182803 RepID=A0A4Y2J9Y9_ARAVE|nr:hypothetical protein AVEN_191882-1 [Araneus ventricosus]
MTISSLHAGLQQYPVAANISLISPSVPDDPLFSPSTVDFGMKRQNSFDVYNPTGLKLVPDCNPYLQAYLSLNSRRDVWFPAEILDPVHFPWFSNILNS